MSTIKVNKIENTATADGGIAIDSSGHVQVDGQQLPTAGALSNRNKIANGAMIIDQRNAGSSVTVNDSNNYFAADRFKFGISSSPTGAGTLQQVSDGPDGFEKSNKFTVTTADSSIPATQSYNLLQEIEGQDVSDLAWGSSAAKTVTFSFYVKTSLNGTFGGSIQNSSRDRSYPFTYAISSSEANTWVRREITIAGDTSGTWLTTNGVGLRVLWGIGNGASRTASAGAWAASDARGATGQVQIIGTNSSTFQVTGVQLEVGDKATPFEHRSYGDELAKCQRYFETSYPPGTSVGSASATAPTSYNTVTGFFRDWQDFKVTKRATPTVKFYSSDNGTVDKLYNAHTTSDISIVADNHSVNGARVSANASSSGNLIRWNYTADSEF